MAKSLIDSKSPGLFIVEYEKVAEYIASSDNPDFALSTLYSEYDQNNIYTYLTY